jgi:hypothetical protein
MSDLRVSTLMHGLGKNASAQTPQSRAVLRKTVGEVLGATFYGEMLKIARSSSLKGEYGHGGRGEDVFQGQLDAEFSRAAGGRMQSGLVDAICHRLTKGKGA